MDKEIWEFLKEPIKIGKIILINFAQQSEAGLIVEIEIDSLGVLRFDDVKDLKTSYEINIYPKKNFLIVEEVSNYQWEDIKYRVSIGDDLISFYSKDIIKIN